MERRALLAAALSLMVFIVWQYLFPPPLPPENQTVAEQSSSGSPTPAGSSPAPAVAAVTPSTSPAPTVAPATGLLPAAAGQPATSPAPVTLPRQERALETKLLSAVFTTEGGGLKSWKLKSYTAYQAGDSVVSTFSRFLGMKEKRSGAAESMDLLSGPYENALPFRLDGASGPDSRYEIVSALEHEIVFRGIEGGLNVTKRYRIKPEEYLASLDITVENRGAGPVVLKPSLSIRSHKHADAGSYAPVPVPAVYIDNKVQRPDASEPSQLTGKSVWAGIDDKYFLRAMVPPSPIDATVSSGPVAEGQGQLHTSLARGPVTLGAGQAQSFEYLLFLGPKKKEVLEKAGHELRASLNFGVFGPVAEVLLTGLKFLYGVLRSWGLSIIVLTVIIKTLLYPLMAKQMESAQKMKEFQPEMAALREKYKDDRNRLNQEMMRFMQEKQLNPLGGCLPLLLQMPIWFALYSVLQNSIELYHTPFLYFPDLSEQDPYGISPAVLGVLMFVQQKMTPPAPGMDPVQAKMMQYMPLIFSAIMFTLPSGLVVYILVNTLLTIAQQWYITKKYEKKTSAVRVEAAGRR